MPKEAQGHWPSNVSAVIITPEEKQEHLAKAPPQQPIQSPQQPPVAQQGGPPVVTYLGVQPQNQPIVSAGAQAVPGAPYATIQTKYVIPNRITNPMGQNMTTEEPSQPVETEETETEEIFGRQAILIAKRMGVDVVWKSDDKTPIDLETAQQLIAASGPTAVYFDFDAVAEIPDPDDETDDPEAAYMATLPTNPPPDGHRMTHKELIQQSQPSPEMIPEPPSEIGVYNPQAGVIQKQQPNDPVSEREKLAWGGVLSTPGQTVYFRPNVIRVEVEGNVKVQKGIKGNVRMMRITRTTPQGTVQLAHATQTQVQAPLSRSPNPTVSYRTANPEADKIPVPKPQVPVPDVNESTSEAADTLEEFDF
jgi:hypothetical protein